MPNWLSGLHIPETYLAALVQTTCRKRGWALDKADLFTEVTTLKSVKEVEKAPSDDGCYIEGLYLEGAGWDFENSTLCRQEPKKLVYELPLIKVFLGLANFNFKIFSFVVWLFLVDSNGIDQNQTPEHI